MLSLLHQEQQWIAAYRKALDERRTGAVERLAVFSSKARGDDNIQHNSLFPVTVEREAVGVQC